MQIPKKYSVFFQHFPRLRPGEFRAIALQITVVTIVFVGSVFRNFSTLMAEAHFLNNSGGLALSGMKILLQSVSGAAFLQPKAWHFTIVLLSSPMYVHTISLKGERPPYCSSPQKRHNFAGGTDLARENGGAQYGD